MADDRIVVELDAEVAEFKRQLTSAAHALRNIDKAAAKTDRRVKNLERNTVSFNGKLRQFVLTMGLARHAIFNVYSMTGRWITAIIAVGGEMERLRFLLRGLADGANDMEKAAHAAEEFQQIMEMSKQNPFTVRTITNSWVKFKSVGLDPANNSLQALLDSVAAFGGTDDILGRATIALQQMAGKGVISMEELRQQLGEAVPSAMKLLAKGLNMTVQEMVDAISRGEVVAKPALKKLASEFDAAFGGAARKLMDSYVGSLARVRTAWTLMLDQMTQRSGLLEVAKDAMTELFDFLSRPETVQAAIDIGLAIKAVVQGFIEGVKFVAKYKEEIWSLIKALVIMKATYLALIGVMKVYGFVSKALAAQAVATGIAYSGMNATLKTSALVWTTLTTKIRATGGALRALMATNPVGWAILIGGAIWGLYEAFKSTEEATTDAMEALELYKGSLTKPQYEAAIKDVKAYEKVLADLNAQLDKTTNQKDREALEQEIALQEIRVRDSMRLLEEAREEIRNSRLAIVERDFDRNIQPALDGLLDTTREMEKASDETFEQDKNVDARLERRVQIWSDYVEKLDSIIAPQLVEASKKIAAANEAVRAAGQDTGLSGIPDDQLTKEQRTLLELIEAAKVMGDVWKAARDKALEHIKTMKTATDLTGSGAGDQAEKARQKFDSFFASSKSRLAGLKADLDGGSSSLAKFESKLAAGFFGDMENLNTNKLREIREILAQIDEDSEALKNKRAFAGIMNDLDKRLAASRAEMDAFNEALTLGSSEVATFRLRSVERQMAALREEAQATGQDLEEFDKTMEELIRNARDTSFAKAMIDNAETIQDLNVEMIASDRQRFEAEQALNRQRVIMFTRIEGYTQTQVEDMMRLQDQIEELQGKIFEQSQPLGRLAASWEDTTARMEEATAGWLEGFSEQLTDLIMDGKASFKDFAESIVRDLVRIMIQSQLTTAAMGLSKFFQPSNATSIRGTDTTGWSDAERFALGGVFGADGSVPLRRYAQGGIASRPQIAIYGEGDDNEAFVPLPDGRSIPVTLKVDQEGNQKPELFKRPDPMPMPQSFDPNARSREMAERPMQPPVEGQEQRPIENNVQVSMEPPPPAEAPIVNVTAPEPAVPNMTVNVINESGTPVQAEAQGGPSFDGEGYVQTIVLKGLSRPGQFRDQVRALTR